MHNTIWKRYFRISEK